MTCSRCQELNKRAYAAQNYLSHAHAFLTADHIDDAERIIEALITEELQHARSAHAALV